MEKGILLIKIGIVLLIIFIFISNVSAFSGDLKGAIVYWDDYGAECENLDDIKDMDEFCDPGQKGDLGFDFKCSGELYTNGRCLTKKGDINGDGFVNSIDLALILGKWNKECYSGCNVDIDENNRVDVFDLAILLNNWGSDFSLKKDELRDVLRFNSGVTDVYEYGIYYEDYLNLDKIGGDWYLSQKGVVSDYELFKDKVEIVEVEGYELGCPSLEEESIEVCGSGKYWDVGTLNGRYNSIFGDEPNDLFIGFKCEVEILSREGHLDKKVCSGFDFDNGVREFNEPKLLINLDIDGGLYFKKSEDESEMICLARVKIPEKIVGIFNKNNFYSVIREKNGKEIAKGEMGRNNIIYIEKIFGDNYNNKYFEHRTEDYGEAIICSIRIGEFSEEYSFKDKMCGNEVVEPERGEQCDNGGLCFIDGEKTEEKCNSKYDCILGFSNPKLEKECVPQNSDGCDEFCRLNVKIKDIELGPNWFEEKRVENPLIDGRLVKYSDVFENDLHCEFIMEDEDNDNTGEIFDVHFIIENSKLIFEEQVNCVVGGVCKINIDIDSVRPGDKIYCRVSVFKEEAKVDEDFVMIEMPSFDLYVRDIYLYNSVSGTSILAEKPLIARAEIVFSSNIIDVFDGDIDSRILIEGKDLEGDKYYSKDYSLSNGEIWHEGFNVDYLKRDRNSLVRFDTGKFGHEYLGGIKRAENTGNIEIKGIENSGNVDMVVRINQNREISESQRNNVKELIDNPVREQKKDFSIQFVVYLRDITNKKYAHIGPGRAEKRANKVIKENFEFVVASLPFVPGKIKKRETNVYGRFGSGDALWKIRDDVERIRIANGADFGVGVVDDEIMAGIDGMSWTGKMGLGSTFKTVLLTYGDSTDYKSTLAHEIRHSIGRDLSEGYDSKGKDMHRGNVIKEQGWCFDFGDACIDYPQSHRNARINIWKKPREGLKGLREEGYDRPEHDKELWFALEESGGIYPGRYYAINGNGQQAWPDADEYEQIFEGLEVMRVIK